MIVREENAMAISSNRYKGARRRRVDQSQCYCSYSATCGARSFRYTDNTRESSGWLNQLEGDSLFRSYTATCIDAM